MLKATAEIFVAGQRSGLVSPKSQINTLHKGPSPSCRLGLTDQKLSMQLVIPATAEVLQDQNAA